MSAHVIAEELGSMSREQVAAFLDTILDVSDSSCVLMLRGLHMRGCHFPAGEDGGGVLRRVVDAAWSRRNWWSMEYLDLSGCGVSAGW